jgi:hypothetical protein
MNLGFLLDTACMQPNTTDSSHLQDINAAFVAGKISRDEARSAVIEVIFNRLHCSRVSLWRFDGEPGALSLLCFASKASGGELDTRTRRLTAVEYRDYFNELVNTGMYVCVDAFADPKLEPMRETHLLPNRVLSTLDAVFMVNGRAYGMVCCEQTDAMRSWQATEVAAVRSIVSKLALLMAGSDDPALWGSPSVPMAPL